MFTASRKTALGLGTMGGMAILWMGAAAFACTAFAGKITVTATDPVAGGATSTASAEGNDGLHSYCPVPHAASGLDGGVSEIAYPAQGMFRNTTFTVKVEPTTACVSQTTLDSATYEVRWLNLTQNGLLTTIGATCNNPAYGPVSVGNMSVSAAGVGGPTAYNQQASAAGDRVNICVTKATGDGTGTSAPELKLYMI